MKFKSGQTKTVANKLRDGVVRIWKKSNGECLGMVQLASDVYSGYLCRDGKSILIGSLNGNVKQFDIPDEKMQHSSRTAIPILHEQISMSRIHRGAVLSITSNKNDVIFSG